MSKFDKLIKKVESFEKLAIFSDRKAFLRTISQASSVTPNMRERVNSLLKDVAALKPGTSQRIQNRLMDFINGTNTDLQALAKAVGEAGYLIPADHATQKENAAKLFNDLNMMLQKNTAAPEEEVMFMPEGQKQDVIKAYPPIDKAQQEALSRIVVIEGLGLPLKIDGKLGPETRAALKAYKKKFNLESLSDQDALAGAQMMADNLKEYRGV